MIVPNPYRCETCDKWRTTPGNIDLCQTTPLSCGEWDAYRKRGCVSHSTHQPEKKPVQCLCEMCRMTVYQCRGQQLKQASSERERVLDEIVGMFDNGQYYGIMIQQMIRGKFKEIELRQQYKDGEPR